LIFILFYKLINYSAILPNNIFEQANVFFPFPALFASQTNLQSAHVELFIFSLHNKVLESDCNLRK
jgi:hypothetical protein